MFKPIIIKYDILYIKKIQQHKKLNQVMSSAL